MRCPFCQHPENRVVDSRLARDGRAIRRRRHCESCAARFTTYEVIEETMIDVSKRDGQSEPFDPEKLLRSVRLACKKRPIAIATLTEFVDRLESRFSSRPKRSVNSTEIGDAVMVFLRDLDPVAYVRYASVYRSFDSVDAFLGELRTFARRPADAQAEAASAEVGAGAEDDPKQGP